MAGEVERVEEEQSADEGEIGRLPLLAVQFEHAHDEQEVAYDLSYRDICPDLGELRVQAWLPAVQGGFRRETGRRGRDEQKDVREERGGGLCDERRGQREDQEGLRGRPHGEGKRLHSGDSKQLELAQGAIAAGWHSDRADW